MFLHIVTSNMLQFVKSLSRYQDFLTYLSHKFWLNRLTGQTKIHRFNKALFKNGSRKFIRINLFVLDRT
jgi:hypothetical protein